VTCAREITLLNFMLVFISLNIGPNNLDPIGNKYLFRRAAEFDPDLMKKFPHLFKPTSVLKITAVQT